MDCFPIKIYIVQNSQTYFKITLKICCCYFSMNCNWLKKLKEWKDNLLQKKEKLKTSKIEYKCSDSETDEYIKLPSIEVHNELESILKAPSIYNLTTNEKYLLWKFRDYLRYKRKTITKFLKSIDWDDKYCTTEAINLLSKWKSINLDECAELLNYNFQNPEIKLHIIKRMNLFSDNQLLLYLPQLIQALKYDEFERGINIGLANFLIEKACHSHQLANYFYWYLIAEIENVQNKHNIYEFVLEKFLVQLESEKLEETLILKNLIMQQRLIDYLDLIFQTLIKENRYKKIETFKYLLKYYNIKKFDEISHPLDPNILINGIDENIEIYKSSSFPIRILFETKSIESGKYISIFKRVKDLRQHQLISHIINFMNIILLKSNLDLKLTPYKILATGINHGFVEYIDAPTIADVLANYNNIQNYLRQHNPYKYGPFGIQLDIVENFVKSCAGYCVITYLLGIGDRHFDNLLLTKDGKLFHIDFSYILGKDPKPMPPPMKFTKEMIEAMGGIESKFYFNFRNYCYLCLLCLRCHANEILNIFDQLSEAYLSNFAINERKNSVYILAENFKLFLTDEEVIKEFEKLLNISASAVFPALLESVHKLAQYLRR